MAVFRVTTDGLQAAITAASPGDTIMLPAGVITCPDANGFIIDKPLTIQGAGRPYLFENLASGPAPDTEIGWSSGTIIRVYNPSANSAGGMNSTAFTLVGGVTPLTNVVIRDLGIENNYVIPVFTGSSGTAGKTAVPRGTGSGIKIDATLGNVQYCKFERLAIRFMGKHGIEVTGGAVLGALDQSEFKDVQVASSRGHGARFEYASDIKLRDCTFVGNEQCGTFWKGCAIIKQYDCAYLDNGHSFVNSGQIDAEGDPASWPFFNQAQCYLKGGSRFSLFGCDFENWAQAHGIVNDVPRAISLETCEGGAIIGTACYNEAYPAPAAGPPLVADSYFILLLSDVTGMAIIGNQIMSCTKSVFSRPGQNVSGNIVMGNNVSYDGSHAAPCEFDIANDIDTASNASGGNVVLQQMIEGSAFAGRNYCAGLQLPMISGVAAMTNTGLKRNTLTYDNAAGSLKLYDGTAWAPVLTGPVFYNDELVTVDDEAVTY